MSDAVKRSFFIVVPPGLEELALSELRLWWPQITTEALEKTVQKGGIELQASLEDGFALNYLLKVPSRILLRITSFKCRDFPKLFKKCQTIPWREFLPSNEVSWEVSSRKSRLSIKSKIEATCQEGFEKYVKGQEPKKGASPFSHKVFVRLEDDLCTISLDTSGMHLHKRGYRTLTAEAPLRETLASALLWSMRSQNPRSSAVKLVDPMCGSGTFLFEGIGFGKPNFEREFAFEHFSNMSPLFKEKYFPVNIPSPFEKFKGFDNDPATLKMAEETRPKREGSPNISFEVLDLFSNTTPQESGGPTWVCVNPPYGQRLKINGKVTDYFSDLLKNVHEKWAPRCVGIVVPKEGMGALKRSSKLFKVLQRTPTSNGGIPVELVVLKGL